MRSTLLALLALCLLAGPALALDREPTRIQTQLRIVHALLSARDVTALPPAARAARARSLDDLARYLERGEFPRRIAGDGFGERQPRFIDDRGVHCAVGQLIADSGQPELARAIADRFEYAFVRDIDEPALVAWAGAHGFTVAELALIQPTYGFEYDPQYRAREGVERFAQDAGLACAREHAHLATVILRVQGTEQGARVTAKEKGPFAQCVAKEMTTRLRGVRGTFDPFVHKLALSTPQELLEVWIGRYAHANGACSPRPGPLAREAVLAVTSTREGLTVKATTTPNNPEINACLESEVTKNLGRMFAAGAWSLRAKHAFTLPARWKDTSPAIMAVRGAAYGCDPNIADKDARFSLSAKVGDTGIALTIHGDVPEKCIRERALERIEQHYRVQRTVDGEASWYFRVDAPVAITEFFIARPLRPGG